MPETTPQTTSAEREPRALGKWMVAVKQPRLPGRKTDRWEVINRSGVRLGVIAWEGGWRQYVFWPNSQTIYAASCLSDLATFVAGLNAAQRRGTRAVQA